MDGQVDPSAGASAGQEAPFFAGLAQSQSVPHGSISVQAQHAVAAAHSAPGIAHVMPISAPVGQASPAPVEPEAVEALVLVASPPQVSMLASASSESEATHVTLWSMRG